MKHFYQETKYTCACATARMILLELKGIIKSEYDIETEMKTDPKVGSSTQDLIDYLTSYGIACELVQDSSIGELKKQKTPLIFLYSIYGTIPHASIISQVEDGLVVLLDPSSGICEMSFDEIEDCWFTDENSRSFIRLSL